MPETPELPELPETPELPFPLDPGWPPAPPPSGPPFLTVTLPPTVPTVKVWPLGFRKVRPIDEAVVRPLIDRIRASSGADRLGAIKQLMEHL
jgi:hypothetical protein